MKYKLLIWVISIAAVMQGCIYIHMTHLSDDDLEWTNSIPLYSEITLKSNNGRTVSVKNPNRNAQFLCCSSLNK
ncbi:hypothetical protein, partial [Muribaculum intestinale]|uniref:hypothetical protein n=1 Tax=Muribaculum intestinale TaxID=1796646 RepID=UPI00248C783E